MTFTRVDYTSLVEPRGGKDYDDPIISLVTVLTLWYCDECGALVVDQPIHKEWHAKQTFLSRVRRRLGLGVASNTAKGIGGQSA